MKSWTVVLKTKGHMNNTGEYVYEVRAIDEPGAVAEAQAVFKAKDFKTRKPSKKRAAPPKVHEVVCWF